MGFIYRLTNSITQEIYIGQTKNNPSIRWANEFSSAFSESSTTYTTKLSKNIRQYGKDNFVCEVIEEVENDLLNEREQYWISYYNSFNNGLNSTSGGSTNKISSSFSWEIRQQIIADLQDNKLSQKEIAEKYGLCKNMVSQINTGFSWHDTNLSYPLRDFQIKDFRKDENGNTTWLKKKENLYQLQKDYFEEHFEEILADIYSNSMCFAANKIGISDNGLRKWLDKKGIPCHIKEFRQWYASEKLHISLPEKKPKLNRKYQVEQYDLQGNYIQTFNSPIDAGRALGNENYRKHIADVCNGRRPTAYGYIWKKKQ